MMMHLIFSIICKIYKRRDMNFNQINCQISQYLSHNINKAMINEITCNSNNTIQLSRGQLLSWLNNLLKINYTKIQQLGSGAVYSQLLDLIYPGKVPMSKINWKAKHQYQYVNNFKVLQQSFVKLNIMRHVDVEKLVKCKYQDNLEFLQWFKKIFDTTACASSKQYDQMIKKSERSDKNQKQNNIPIDQKSDRTFDEQKGRQSRRNMEQVKQLVKKSKTDGQQIISVSPKKSTKFMGQMQQSIEHKLMDILRQGEDQKAKFYLRKLKEIEHLMEDWESERKSSELIRQVRKIILAAPSNNWKVQDARFIDMENTQSQPTQQQPV